MAHINEAIHTILEQEGMTRTELAKELGITPGMLSHYDNYGHHPRLNVAARVWGKYRISVEPYTDLALSDEWERQNED